MNRSLYSSLWWLAMPLVLARLWWRGRKEPGYRVGIAERLGFYKPQPPAMRTFMVHAVSVGETRAAEPLVEALLAAWPDSRVLLTHMTPTGRATGRALFAHHGARVIQSYLPYDTGFMVRRFLRHFAPRICILMETEVWPNLLRAAHANRVPMVLANARLSEKSHAQGQRLAAVMRPAARSLALVLAQSEADALRLRDAGAPQVVVSGNLKYDLSPDVQLLERGAAWRGWLDRPVVLAAITREGEEAILLQAWLKQQPSRLAPLKRPLLLIVPRHPQRFDEVASLVRETGLTLARRSTWGEVPNQEACAADVWLGDSMREMALYYATAQVALLGGSFAPLGGHNLIEAAACGCPLVMGPSSFNFSEAAALSLAAGASARVTDMEHGVALALDWLGDPPALARRAHDAVQFAAQHRGAARRMAQSIVGLLPELPATPR